MPFHINLGGWGSIFAVPSQVVDNDLKIASAYQLKVLLYLLRHCGEELTYEKIGEELSIHPADVKDSVLFWSQRGLIVQNGDELTPANAASGVPNVSEPQPQGCTSPTGEEAVRLQPRPLTRQPRPSIQFVSQQLAGDSQLAGFMDEAQTILQKPLSSGDICTLYMLTDTYGLPPEVILMLIQYSVSIDKANLHFIEKEGIRWSDEGISDVEQADAKISALKSRFSAWGTVAAVFGIKNVGSPTKKQLAFADCWLNDWKFSPNMLREAYERCVDKKNGVDLSYINGTLRNWHKNGVKSVEEISLKDSGGKSGLKAKGAKNSSYDIDELDKTSFFDE